MIKRNAKRIILILSGCIAGATVVLLLFLLYDGESYKAKRASAATMVDQWFAVNQIKLSREIAAELYPRFPGTDQRDLARQVMETMTTETNNLSRVASTIYKSDSKVRFFFDSYPATQDTIKMRGELHIKLRIYLKTGEVRAMYDVTRVRKKPKPDGPE